MSILNKQSRNPIGNPNASARANSITDNTANHSGGTRTYSNSGANPCNVAINRARNNEGTRTYNANNHCCANNSIDLIGAELQHIADLSIGGGSPLRTPLAITLDMSKSMEKHISTLKLILKRMHEELSVVNQRVFTLLIIGIYNSKAKVLYFGDLDKLDINAFIASLPEHGAGRTPLANAFHKADVILNQLASVLEAKKHYHTLPIFFSITDSASTENKSNISDIVEKFTNDVLEGRKLVAEFVTDNNPNGLSLNGYKVKIDADNKEEIISGFMKALKLATSTVANSFGLSNIHLSRHNRTEYNNSMSAIMLAQFDYHFNNYNKGGN